MAMPLIHVLNMFKIWAPRNIRLEKSIPDIFYTANIVTAAPLKLYCGTPKQCEQCTGIQLLVQLAAYLRLERENCF
jgi:hypothetical protein